MWNSCTSVFPNTNAWEQHELNKASKQKEEGKKRDISMEKSKAGMKEKEDPAVYHYQSLINNHNVVIFSIKCKKVHIVIF